MSNHNADFCEVCATEEYEFLDLFGIGNLTDFHYKVVVSEDELARRYAIAGDLAKRLNYPPSPAFEEELGLLTAPKLTWEDFCLSVEQRKQEERGRLDWNRPKLKQLAAGLFTPERDQKHLNFLVLLDWSASMQKEDASYLVSQLQVLGRRGQGVVVCFDHQPRYDHKVELNAATLEELNKIKLAGGGGTLLLPVFQSYQEELGDFDLILILTDGQVFDLEALKKIAPPQKTEIIWLVVNHQTFEAPFGRTFKLYN